MLILALASVSSPPYSQFAYLQLPSTHAGVCTCLEPRPKSQGGTASGHRAAGYRLQSQIHSSCLSRGPGKPVFPELLEFEAISGISQYSTVALFSTNTLCLMSPRNSVPYPYRHRIRTGQRIEPGSRCLYLAGLSIIRSQFWFWKFVLLNIRPTQPKQMSRQKSGN